MTDARHPAMGSGSACPDFESLSCYADGEAEPATAAALAAHVGLCAHCATLAARLRESLVTDDARRDGGIGGSGCVGEEHLVVYASGGLSGAERTALHAHLGGCDGCLRALAHLQRRLSMAAAIATPVPVGVQQRARLAFETGTVSPTLAAERPRRVETGRVALLDRLRGLLRVPILVPAALAAGALLAVSLQPGQVDQNTSGERSRAIAPETVRLWRITAVEATVRSRPSMRSEVVATVQRGARLEVAGEERDWYEVRLEGGRPGWVEREAFE
jgi:anti-sigma factor RsiW